ncbi:MAG: aldo/keto reductase [Anaerolineales bacterium]|nr:aldo/keto reductase [Anaerolineales bacterium]
MQTRRFGRTGHFSTVAILGGAAFGKTDQATTDAAMGRVLAAGVNHFDIAPSYGDAEERLGSWVARERKRLFLGCKTTERSREDAAAELRRSLERLRTDQFDLYQLHAVKTMEELDAVTARDGALEAAIAAREQGLTRFIGFTGHGLQSPAVFLEALRRFDFDSVLFPINARLFANADYRRDADALLHECRARDVGVMAIKSVTKGPWGDRPRTHATWYEPFTDAAQIQRAVNFALSQDITGLCTVGDVTVLPLFLDACAHFTRMSAADQEAMIADAMQYEPLFV